MDGAEKKNLAFTSRPIRGDLQSEAVDWGIQAQSMKVFLCLLSCNSLEAGLKEVLHDVLFVTTQDFSH